MEKVGRAPGGRCLAVDRTEPRHDIPIPLGIGSLGEQCPHRPDRRGRGQVEPEESSYAVAWRRYGDDPTVGRQGIDPPSVR